MKKIILILSVLSFTTLLFSQQPQLQDDGSDKAKESIEKESKIIPITEIPSRADQTHIFLKKIQEKITVESNIKKIRKELPVLVDSLRILFSDSIYHKLPELSRRTLQNIRQEWGLYKQKFADWENIVSSRTQELEVLKKTVMDTDEEWRVTEKEAAKQETPDIVHERIVSIINEIDTVKAHLQERFNALLVMQSKISQEQVKINDLISRIDDSMKQLSSHLFAIDNPPIWEMFTMSSDTTGFSKQLEKSWGGFFRTMSGFARANEGSLYLHLIIFLFLLIIIYYFFMQNREQKLFDEGDEALKAYGFFVSRPVSATFLITLFFSIWLYRDPPVAVAELVVVLLLIPVLRLSSGVVVEGRKRAVVALVVIYLFVFIHNNIVAYPLLQRILQVMITLATMVLFAWLIKNTWPLKKQYLRPWPKLLFQFFPFGEVLLLVSLISNIVGNVSLAQLLTEAMVKSVLVAVILYTFARVLDGLIVLLIRKRASKDLKVVKKYAPQMELWSIRIVHFIAFMVWIRSTFKSFRLYQPLISWYSDVMAVQWSFGTIAFSLQNLVDFVLVIVITYFIVHFIQIFLDVEIFTRIKLPRGIPGAISMVVRYTLVAIGILLAISSLGIDLGKFGILAGALGVGIGFGLQNVIANFVSGLILAFERPIQVGDKIEIGPVLGNVKQIGVRSSTVKTFDGSEVIVPNADFISNQVINWTLSDSRQRMKLPVNVAYGSDPKKVLDLLLKVARDHPEVIENPAPVATFNGFGDYALDFTLYYWITKNIFQTKTEVALKVFEKLKEEGIEIPFPRQEIYLKNQREAGKKAPAKKKGTAAKTKTGSREK
jgi:small-conductance mechanosensitive channel